MIALATCGSLAGGLTQCSVLGVCGAGLGLKSGAARAGAASKAVAARAADSSEGNRARIVED